MAVISVPKALEEKLGEEAVLGLIEVLNDVEEKARENVVLIAEEKYERRLTEEIAGINKRITDEIAGLKAEDLARIEKRITDERAKLDKSLSEVKADIIKWMFIFWVGQFFAIAALLFSFFR